MVTSNERVGGAGVLGDAPRKRTRNLLEQKRAEYKKAGAKVSRKLMRNAGRYQQFLSVFFCQCWYLKGRPAWSDRKVSLLLACCVHFMPCIWDFLLLLKLQVNALNLT